MTSPLLNPASAFARPPSVSPHPNPEAETIAKLLHVTSNHWQLPFPGSHHVWSQDDLQTFVQRDLRDVEILLLSQREPYVHHADPHGIRLERPAGGLVTALEPVMAACAGTWIAHGSGSADWDVVSRDNHIGVPPEQPVYTLRRLMLSDEEIDGHYLGLCNQALWPLCNQAHVRPVFRWPDWAQYEAVNRRFCDAVVQESKTPNPLVLVQDYHLALVPRMLRERMPDATIATFWHIPWPHAKAFGICPWREELLQGLLGSDVLGFQIPEHSQYFMQAVEQFLDTDINWKTQIIGNKLQRTRVRDYPISIAWPCPPELVEEDVTSCRRRVEQTHRLPKDLRLGVGVDRLDYVKGILERFMAIERLFELEPQWIGRFGFIQIMAPSRMQLAAYRHYGVQIKRLATAINLRYGRGAYQPITLVQQGQSQDQVYRYYRASDLCFVSSLDDGMNLVAKEFVAARDDLQGVLVLSQFAGASSELPQALQVNPYNLDECAHALSQALTMSSQQQCDRMLQMREHVAEHNVYRWAGHMLRDALGMRRAKAYVQALVD